MEIIKRLLSSVFFWGAWVVIPIIMEILPAIGSIHYIRKRKKRIKNDQETVPFKPDISLIIPVYNSQDTLEACIRSIYESTYPSRSIRVFLVDNKGGDASFSVFAKCQTLFPKLRMQWLNSEQGKSRALNLALYNSEGKYIINLDSDGQLEKHALENMIDKFEKDPKLNCMTGSILTFPEKIEEYPKGLPRLLRELEFMEYAQAFMAGRSYSADKNEIYTLSGAFSAFRKSAILGSRLYNTDTICEDTQVTFQMRYIFHERIDICENAIFFVDPIEDMNKLYTQRQRWQRGSLEVGKMFMGKDFSIRKAFRDVNVKTLLYDHTFAFPRMIWYLAIICLLFMNYSVSLVFLSAGLTILMYVIIGYFYFHAAVFHMQVSLDTQKYYKSKWWAVILLPLFNLFVFFIRFIGIINSIDTDSSWKTKNFTQEKNAAKERIKQDFCTFSKQYQAIYHLFNKKTSKEEEEEPFSAKEDPGLYRPSWYIGTGIVFLIAILLFGIFAFVKFTYGIGLSELFSTLKGNVNGTSKDVIWVIIRKCVIPIVSVLGLGAAVAAADHVLWKKRKRRLFSHRVINVLSAIALAGAVLFVNFNFECLSYVKAQSSVSTIYESYYVDPRNVAISNSGTKKNLIYIYLESMETTYASVEDGGMQPTDNYMPELTRLAKDNISFSEDSLLGGFHAVNGTGYTMGALLGTTTGVPYAFTIDSTEINSVGSFAGGIISLGDILAEQGYNQEFLCGSDGTFGGRKMYFEQHGGYTVFDLYTAREKGYIPEDYYVWWGFEDYRLFDIAKDEIARLAQEDAPFNFTMLTVDTHHLDGYFCDVCEHKYESLTANVVDCTDRLVSQFIEWCQGQDFYEDTVIVITGDHPRMDTNLVDGADYYDRTVYNCIINSDTPVEKSQSNRQFTTMDMFPTILAALGYDIEGDRLGLGTNMFSEEQTLLEKKGYVWLGGELEKKSDYYLENFAPELLK